MVKAEISEFILRHLPVHHGNRVDRADPSGPTDNIPLTPTMVPRRLLDPLVETPAGAQIRSVWVVEQPNHGAAAELNEAILKKRFHTKFSSMQNAAAIQAFLDSDMLSPIEKQNLVGIGHSAGTGVLVIGAQKDSMPFRALILVDPPYLGVEGFQYLQELYRLVKHSNSRRPTSWASLEDAMQWIRTHHPWNTFDAAVLDIVKAMYFKTNLDGRIVPKTTVEQENASFLYNDAQLTALPHLEKIRNVLPTHFILCSKNDIWTPEIYNLIQDNIKRDRDRMASVRTIPNVGHYIPLVKPRELAVEIFQILCSRTTKLSKL
ncbi:Alpha/beta hydrolase family-domain-containing protein [Mycena galopus ATCC 62051]|nr:Alpha/beta hydrolase family-domain-containing protein [Mycena galopus ATCC 62051]